MQPASLQDLPSELLIMILSYCSALTVASLSQVCTYLRSQAILAFQSRLMDAVRAFAPEPTLFLPIMRNEYVLNRSLTSLPNDVHVSGELSSVAPLHLRSLRDERIGRRMTTTSTQRSTPSTLSRTISSLNKATKKFHIPSLETLVTCQVQTMLNKLLPLHRTT